MARHKPKKFFEEPKHYESPVIKPGVFKPSPKDRVKTEAYRIMGFYINPLFSLYHSSFPDAGGIELRLQINTGLSFDIFTEPYTESFYYRYPPIKEINLFISGLEYICDTSDNYDFEAHRPNGKKYWSFVKIFDQSKWIANQLNSDKEQSFNKLLEDAHKAKELSEK